VFTALSRVTPESFYYKTKTGREVDLVALLPSAPGQERIILLIQLCASPYFRFVPVPKIICRLTSRRESILRLGRQDIRLAAYRA